LGHSIEQEKCWVEAKIERLKVNEGERVGGQHEGCRAEGRRIAGAEEAQCAQLGDDAQLD
jgi:hypothetical protein